MTMFFGALKVREGAMEQSEPESKEEKATEEKSASAEVFLRTPEAKEFIKRWANKKKEGEPKFTRRGVTELLRNLHQVPGLDSNKKIIKKGDDLLALLGGMDGLQGFLAGWKAKSEGLIKGIKSIFKS